MKASYHPSILIAFYLHCLPDDLAQKIPRSTKHDWLHRNLTACVGYDWFRQNQPLFFTLKEVANSKKLMKINRALLRIIALHRFLTKYAAQIRERVFQAAATVVINVKKVQDDIGPGLTSKLLNLSYRQYWQLKQKMRCKKSLLNLCLPKHPTQLMRKEVNIIKKYGEDIRFIHWPLSSIYHKIVRDSAAHFHISTFYKYTGLMKLKRPLPKHRHKNHCAGIRATAPLQLLHADVTVFKTTDNIKAYIYLIQDNFSRAILKSFVARQCRTGIRAELLRQVHHEILQPSNLPHTLLMTDDGSENFGEALDFIRKAENPTIQHIIAQQDVEFSNSMIEAANKNLKYRFLYHQHIPGYEELCKYVQQAVEDYNNRPHAVLNGLTPLEVLNGKTIDKADLQKEMLLAKAQRMTENKKETCCSYSF